ncbi:4Fe-4S dicluster domain-containing protein [Chloroflexota bacterium]
MQIGFYFDQSRCTGCGACRVACKDWHNIPAGPENWIRVLYSEKGSYPDVSVSYVAMPCYHCLDPICVKACPAHAISKRDEDGIVVVDSQACLGKNTCKTGCLTACPYKAPQFGPGTAAKMRKCDFCLDRWREGEKPVCAEACPTRALDAGVLSELEAKYGHLLITEGFTYSKRTKPAIVFKLKLRKASKQ